MDPSFHEALLRWRDAGTLTWRGPALMLFARAALAVGAQAIVAAVFASRSSPTPWHGAEPWLPAPTPPVGSCTARPPSRTSWAPALASRPLRGSGISVHLGADRANDLRLSGPRLPGSAPEYRTGGRDRSIRLVIVRCCDARWWPRARGAANVRTGSNPARGMLKPRRGSRAHRSIRRVAPSRTRMAAMKCRDSSIMRCLRCKSARCAQTLRALASTRGPASDPQEEDHRESPW
jgi:hypothetical protein